MLRFVISRDRGEGDRLLTRVAEALEAEGVPLAGAVQRNVARGERRRADMDLRLLPGGEIVRISQDLGDGATGCRLDPAGLETAVGYTEAALAARPALLIVNKFGKQELAGRGFRPLIGAALAEDIPVLTGVNASNVAGFQAYAEGLAEALPADEAALLDWARGLAMPAR
jgi:nucleoside-triphosphatase THEP1